MSLTQTYYVASAARSKLGKEAGRADHNLRLLVGHANLLDQLMVDLADAERESENWLNQSIREASRPEEPRRVQWMDSIAEDYEDDAESDDESDDGSDIDDEEMFALPTSKTMKSAPVAISSDDAEYDDEEEEEELALTRVASKHSPPELTLDDSDSESDEEDEDYIPMSPEDALFELTEKERQAITTTAFYDLKSQQGIEDYIMQQQPLIAAC